MKSNPKQKINFSKLNPIALTILRCRKWQDQDIVQMTANEIFLEICRWHGIMDLGEELSRAQTSTAFKNICRSNGFEAIGVTLFSILFNIRSACQTLPAADHSAAAESVFN